MPKDLRPKDWKGVTLDTNYFQIVLNTAVYEYAASFTPDLGDSPKRKRVIRKRKIPHEIILMGNCLYTSGVIPEDQVVWTVPAREIGMTSDVTVKLSLVNKFPAGSSVPTHVFSALFQRALSMETNYKQIQRSFFDFGRILRIPGSKYEIIPGVEVTVVPTMRGPSLLADVTNKVARSDTVLNIWQDARCNLSRFRRAVEGSVVFTYYNNRSYIVKRVCEDMMPSSTFTSDDGKAISFARYLQQRYGKTATVGDQPMLECEAHGRPVYLIPEFCRMTGIDERDRADYKLMSKITKELFPEPGKRMEMIRHEVGVIERNSCKLVNLTVSKPITVQGSIIRIPALPKMNARDNISRENARNLAGGLPLKKVIIVCRKDYNPDRFADDIERSMKSIGMNFTTEYVDWNIRRFEDDVRRCCGSEVSSCMVLFICPKSKDDEAYSRMKVFCSHELQIPSQVVTEKNLDNPKRGRAVASNVIRQMVVKLGKCPWVMNYHPITKGTMVIGLDVCHTTPIHKSVVGVVASLDDTFGKYYSAFIVQDRGKEIVRDLRPIVVKALQKYKKRNGAFPRNILFLRDGVGDGQLMYVNDVEMTAVSDAIRSTAGPSTNLSFVVVKKRIRSRLFFNGGNPVPGTLVDDTITHPDWYDFFLVSHRALNGTVSPTHYNVLMDEMKWPKSELQYFIFLLCHQYYNWDGSISVPAPCQYAHKMAFLYGKTLLSSETLDLTVPERLKDTLLQI